MMEKNSPSVLHITDEEFVTMRTLIHTRLGIHLTEQKRGLLVTRLNKSMQQAGLKSFQQYAQHIKNDPTGETLRHLADLISTNHTFFFRESKHFDFLKKTALPAIFKSLKAQHSQDLRIWCTAASTGEEPYSLMMTLMEHLGVAYPAWDAGLLATDISQEALMTAEKGVYSEEKIRKVPQPLQQKYFQKNQEGRWAVIAKLRKEITFRRLNLIQPHFPFKKPFQVIFCRNVMIYFDQPTIQNLVNRFYEWTTPGGYLFVGFSESLSRIKNPFQYVQPAIYQKPPVL